MEDNTKKQVTEVKNYWFKRRRFGFGFMPVTWQGWLVTIGYILVIIFAGMAFLDNNLRETSLFFLIFILATGGLLRIMLIKGPRSHWRWGRKPNDNPEEDF